MSVFLISGGLETETEYKYKGEDEKCEFIKKDVKVYINDSVTISSNETGELILSSNQKTFKIGRVAPQ